MNLDDIHTSFAVAVREEIARYDGPFGLALIRVHPCVADKIGPAFDDIPVKGDGSLPWNIVALCWRHSAGSKESN
jgi:hypothetical protein